jgi:Arc/MetJ-type ribon-helix-helix transcriptional regulator
MTVPVPTRFSDQEVEILDELVAAGIGENRSAVVRKAVMRLADAVRRAEDGVSIAASYEEIPQSADDDQLALASAMAMTEAEPW